jgi:hypothetical protein
MRIDENTGHLAPNGKVFQNASPVTIVFAGGK